MQVFEGRGRAVEHVAAKVAVILMVLVVFGGMTFLVVLASLCAIRTGPRRFWEDPAAKDHEGARLIPHLNDRSSSFSERMKITARDVHVALRITLVVVAIFGTWLVSSTYLN